MPPRITTRTRPAALLALFALAVATAASTPENTQIILENFRTRGQADDQKTEWELSGRNAVVDGPQVELREATLVFRPGNGKGDPVTITSPRFSYNRTTKAGASDAPLQLRHRQVTIDGEGYDILPDQQVLHIRSRVLMRIRHEKGLVREQLLPSFGTPARDTPKPPAEGTTP